MFILQLATAWVAVTTPSASAETAAKALTVEDCVRYALEGSAKVEEAHAKVEEFEGRLAEIESIFYPKLMGMAILAPMFTVKFNATERNVERRWKSIKDWGPYTQVQAVLAQPLYTFGRAEKGEEAARERMLVEKARVREVRNMIALEIRKFHALYLYALSMQPSLENASLLLDTALEKAQEMYDKQTGDVTQVDLNKLVYGKSEVKKFIIKAKAGEQLLIAALKHTMGWPSHRELVLKGNRLSKKLPESDGELAQYIMTASENRPEWAQLDHGNKASLAWADAEALANAPVFFVGGQFRGAWAPTRDDTRNPYHWDPFNEVFVGAAVGLQFNIDPAKASAREDIALAVNHQVAALRRFAETGIPMQVQKAYSDMKQARDLTDASRSGVKATKKWMTFAATAFISGTGEAKDVLEGLAMYLSAKNGQYEALRDYKTARADLDFAMGIAEHEKSAKN